MYTCGISRVHDYENYDFIKHKAKYPEVEQALYKQFGILNMFCPYRPTGRYLLDFRKYEEKIVARMLIDLAKKEGMATNLCDIKFNGKSQEKLPGEFMKKLPDVGMLELTYKCEPEKEDLEFRKSLGVKYLDWEEE